MASKPFARKYGLEGKGTPVRISKKTQEYIKELNEQSGRIVKAGKFWAKTCNFIFGR